MVRDPSESLCKSLLNANIFTKKERAACRLILDVDQTNFSRILFAIDHYGKQANSELIQEECHYIWHMFEITGCNINKFADMIVEDFCQSQNFELRMKLKYLIPLLCSRENQPCEYQKCVCTAKCCNDMLEKGGTNETKTNVTKNEICRVPTSILVATDFDGTFGNDVEPQPPSSPTLCISGRTFQEYNSDIQDICQEMPVYIRGSGKVGDGIDAGEFKAMMILRLGVTHFLEDDPTQIAIIKKRCPHVVVCKVTKH